MGGLSTTDIREIKTIIIGVFNDKFLADLAEKVALMVSEKFEAQLNAQKIEISNLKEDVATLKKENANLHVKLDSQEQANRSENVRVFGIQPEHGENIRDKMLCLFKNKLKVNILDSDVKKCHRITAKMSNDRPAAVLVRFASSEVRLSVLKSRKLLKNTGIYINEDLTKSRLSLYNRAKQTFGERNTWVWSGNVLVRGKDNSVSRILSEADLLGLQDQVGGE